MAPLWNGRRGAGSQGPRAGRRAGARLLSTDFAHIYVSPHLDDAVFSCGGGIREQSRRGERVLVATFATVGAREGQTLPAILQKMHASSGFGAGDDPFAARRQEDARALETIGAEPLHLGTQGSLYREDAEARPLYRGLDFLGPPVPGDRGLLEQMREHLLQLHREHPKAIFYAPLGAGGHVDHRLANLAARALPAPVRFYEDMPYVLLDRLTPFTISARWLVRVLRATPPADASGLAPALQGWSRWLGGPGFALRRQRPPRGCRWRTAVFAIDLPGKLDAMMQYTSQFSPLFGSRERASKALDAYAASIRRGPGAVERLWLLEQQPEEGVPTS